MSNTISQELLAQFYAQESSDPFLILVTLTNTAFTARLVNNSSDIVSRGFTYTAIPMKIRLPVDDGQSARDFAIDFDNVNLNLIAQMRGVTDTIGVKIEMILASLPDAVQMSQEDLLLRSVTYNATKISAQIVMDDFLAVAMTSEAYTPDLYPGLF